MALGSRGDPGNILVFNCRLLLCHLVCAKGWVNHTVRVVLCSTRLWRRHWLGHDASMFKTDLSSHRSLSREISGTSTCGQCSWAISTDDIPFPQSWIILNSCQTGPEKIFQHPIHSARVSLVIWYWGHGINGSGPPGQTFPETLCLTKKGAFRGRLVLVMARMHGWPGSDIWNVASITTMIWDDLSTWFNQQNPKLTSNEWWSSWMIQGV